MTALLGPLPCQGCRQPVVWNRKQWKNPGQWGGVHACRPVAHERIRCGVVMPYVHERCARLLGHRYEHRSRYAMDNALRAATGRGL